MKAFWWFKENEIAGMARPGINCTRWFDFSSFMSISCRVR
jgi:hypothetical protein